MAKNISIDRTKRLREEPHKGHNRWHPDIAPVIEVEPGEEVTLETRDAMDLQIGPRTTVKDLEKLERTVAHPLTGPVYVKGAKPGDLLEIEYLDIVPGALRLDALLAGRRLPAGPVRPLLRRALGHHAGIRHLAAASGRAHSERRLHGHRGRGAVARAAEALVGEGKGTGRSRRAR